MTIPLGVHMGENVLLGLGGYVSVFGGLLLVGGLRAFALTRNSLKVAHLYPPGCFVLAGKGEGLVRQLACVCGRAGPGKSSTCEACGFDRDLQFRLLRLMGVIAALGAATVGVPLIVIPFVTGLEGAVDMLVVGAVLIAAAAWVLHARYRWTRAVAPMLTRSGSE